MVRRNEKDAKQNKEIGRCGTDHFVIGNVHAYADYTAVYDNSQKAIEISGNCIPGKAVVISVYKDTAAAPILADAVKSGTDGYYFFTMLLPKNLSGGKYYLKVGGEEIVYDFMYVDEDSITARLEELNAAAAQGGTIFENYLTQMLRH